MPNSLLAIVSTHADGGVFLYARLLMKASVTITVPGKPDGVYDLDPLARSINVEASTYKVGKARLELVLAKAQPGIAWKQLDGVDEEASGTAPASISST